MKKLRNRLVFFNGKFVEEKDAKLSIYDSALMFGDMVFEMTRSFNKKQFLLEEHIDRLLSGLKILRIKIKYTKKYQASNNNFFERKLFLEYKHQ